MMEDSVHPLRRSTDLDEDEVTDAMILAAIKKRLLGNISGADLYGPGGGGGSGKDAASIVNNVYGGQMPSLMGTMGYGGPGGPSDDDFDYLVDIKREDLPELNPLTGKPRGWTKTVHRRRELRGK